ncbi:MAG: glycosyltransferase family 39 protein [Candidatus Eremiobacteraeota bacterium]|uniref:Glycosyltransferase RgtA/B/C/D-like domain-containing protein n=1 Tax=mine drainage metagenome TaxID=410659 RepID=E6PEL1_9ZZZZ|nr:glycosyltransferase family 39 protein [Candidatus Eremiobacteraeota bacterium]
MSDRYLRLAWAAAGITFFLHLLANPHYGFFRDELYFIICGRHPSWGYVDQPPLVPLIAAGSQLFGISLLALRATAALCAAGSVFVIVRIVTQLGGGRFAEIFAAIVVALTPVLAVFGTQVGPDMVGLWLWPLAALYLLRIADGASPRLWLAVGAVLGVSFEGKYSVVFFAVALAIGLALTKERRIFATPFFWYGALVGVAIALPNLLWQIAHDLPMLSVLEAGQHGKNVILSPLSYLVQEILLTNPLLAWIWIVGIVSALRTAALRWLGIAALVMLAEMMLLRGKNYYPADIYSIYIALGALAIARSLTVRWGRIALVCATPILAAWMIPVAVPILPTPQILAYTAFLRNALHLSVASENHKVARLGQDFADMHGWPRLAATVASIYAALPPSERAGAAIFTDNYGEASAIAFFNPTSALPPVLSGHNQYWLWGTHGASGATIVAVDSRCPGGAGFYARQRIVARFSNPLGMPYEDDLPIRLCRKPRGTLADIWSSVRHYN